MENNEEITIDEQVSLKQRSLFARIAFSLLWFLPVVIIINMFVGGVVGGFAQTGGDFQENYNAGAEAAKTFFDQYGGIVFGGEICVWLALSFYGVLPGTAKFKKN